jgi:hypothetical protein
MTVTDRVVQITTNPGPPCVNPVFEFKGAPSGGVNVSLRDHPIGKEHYAWDGRVLWLDTTIESATQLVVTFGNQAAKTAP